MKKGLLVGFLIIFFVTIGIVNGQGIGMEKEVPHKVKFDSVAKVKITITNEGSEKNVTVMEVISQADPVDPPEFAKMSTPEDLIAVPPSHYRWNFILEKNAEKTLIYEIRPNSPEDCITGPTTISFDDKDITFDSKIIPVVCNRNGECEPSLNENYFNCPQDCPSGSDDGICDLLADGRCDPDCTVDGDPDCVRESTSTSFSTSTTVTEKTSECGDGICEKGENKSNCPEDCESGFPYYILWLVIAIVIVIISIMIVYESKKASGGKYE